MTRLPGLTPSFRDDRRPQDRFRRIRENRTRLDARLSDPQALRPASSPVNNYVGPPALRQNNLGDLADSLGRFNQSLTQFGTAAMQDRARRQEEFKSEEEEKAQWAALMDDFSSWGEAVRENPDLAAESPYFQGVYRGTLAKRNVLMKGHELMHEYLTSELSASTDPTAIRDFVVEGMRDTLSTFDSEYERRAAIGEVEKMVENFMSVHRKRASDNLRTQTRETASSLVTTKITDAAYKAEGEIRSSDPVAENLTPIQRALLNGISHGESAGRYNVRYDGSPGGALFDDFSKHPRIFVDGPKGKTSAAGRYQFTATTWDDVMGANTPFIPENQDIAAVKYAERRYGTDADGRDLWTALKQDGFSPGIQRLLGGAWEALKKNHSTNERAFNTSLERSGEEQPVATSPMVRSLSDEIQDLEQDMLGAGISGPEINETIMNGIVTAVQETGNLELFEIAMQPRRRVFADGSVQVVPGPGTTAKGRERIDQVTSAVLRDQEQAAKRQQEWVDEKKGELRENAIETALSGLLKQMERGETPNISEAELEEMLDTKAVDEETGVTARLGRETVEEIMSIQRRLQQDHQSEEPETYARIMADVHEGRMSPSDVLEAVARGDLRTTSGINEALRVARTVNDNDLINDPWYSRYASDIAGFVTGYDFSGRSSQPHLEAEARAMLLDAWIDWNVEFKQKNDGRNPRPSEKRDFLNNERDAIIEAFAERPELDSKADQVQPMREIIERAPSRPEDNQATGPTLTPEEARQQAVEARKRREIENRFSTLGPQLFNPEVREEVERLIEDIGQRQDNSTWWEYLTGTAPSINEQQQQEQIQGSAEGEPEVSQWRERPLFESAQDLEEQISLSRDPDTRQESRLYQIAVVELGLQTQEEIAEFIRTQGRLLIQQDER